MTTATQGLQISFVDNWDSVDLILYRKRHDNKPANTKLGDIFKKVTDKSTGKLIALDKDTVRTVLLQTDYRQVTFLGLYIMSSEIPTDQRLCFDYFVVDRENKKEFLHLLLRKKK